MSVEVKIDAVEVRERSRKEMRGIDVLAESIKEIGLLHPPVVRMDGKAYVLVAGHRRIEAMRQLGFDRIHVTVVRNLVSEVSALRAEGEENTCREAFTPSEAVAHADRIEAVMAARAKERQQAAGGGEGRRGGDERNAGADSSPALPSPKGKTRDQVAEAVGLSHPTLTKARAVVDAAKNPDLPAEVRAIAEAAAAQMDETGKVEPAFKAVEKAKVEHDPARKAIDDLLNDDTDVQLATWRLNFSKALKPLTDLPTFAADVVVAKADPTDLDDLAGFVAGINRWWSAIDEGRRATTRLRVVGGGS